MYSFQKEYTLIPHSPLIHFQYGDNGAALRATEVKPKLDRYIIKHYRKDYGELPQNWRNDQSKDALNYQMRIISLESNRPINLGNGTNYDIFYGNIGRGPKKKGLKNKQKLVITCFNESLREYIDEVIGDFFIVTNFGTMQSKGFGSFTVDGRCYTSEQICDILKSEYTNNGKCYVFDAEGGNEFIYIKTIYSLIKSGVNLTTDPNDTRLTEEQADEDPDTPYKRSILFDYMHDLPSKNLQNIGNEKAWMKQNDISPKLGREKDQQDAVSKYVRALFGVCERIGYKTSYRNNDRVVVSIKCVTKDKLMPKKRKIERLNSPILFKVINNTVYFVGCEPNEEIYGTEFEFSSKMDGIYRKGTLFVPEKSDLPENFMNDFMNYAWKKIKNCKVKFNINSINIREV